MRGNIRSKILLLFFSIITVTIFGLYVYLNTTLVDIVFGNIKKQIYQETQFAERYFNERLEAMQGAVNLDVIADEIGRDLNLRVTIIALDGQVVGDSRLTKIELQTVENHMTRPEIVAALRKGSGEAKRYSSTLEEDSYYYAKKIINNPYFSGILRSSVKLSAIDVVSNKLKQVLIVASLTALVLVLIFGYIATLFISRPILELSQTAKEISKGNFGHRSLVHSNDEIGEMSIAINHMSEQIKQRIDEVSQNRSRLEAVFLNMFDGIMIVDQNGRIRLINEMLKKLITFSDNPVGKKLLQVNRNLEIQEIVDAIIDHDEKFIRREVTVDAEEEKILLVHATTIERKGIKDGAALVFHDITEMRKLETMRKDFVANVSHELRTPITSIRGYAETLYEGALDDKEAAKEFLNIIKIDAERLGKLVDDILDLSRIESGKVELKQEPVDIRVLTERVLLLLKRKIEKQGITVTLYIEKDVQKVKCDEFSMEQILVNLLSNAIKYNQPNGTIKITISQTHTDYVFKIQDTGIGIPTEDLPRIFEKFYRVDKARSRDLGGTGLGLSIVKHLVQAHFGTVKAASTMNSGTEFTFTIPKV